MSKPPLFVLVNGWPLTREQGATVETALRILFTLDPIPANILESATQILKLIDDPPKDRT